MHASQSFENPWPSSSWANGDTSEQQPQGPDRARARSSTASGPYLPPALTAAHPMAAGSARTAIHNPDVLFVGAPVAPPLSTAPIPPRLPYPEDYVSQNLRRAKTAPPPVPPHPYRARYASGVPPGAQPPIPRKPTRSVPSSPPPLAPRPLSAPHPEPVPLILSEEEEAESIAMPAPELRMETRPLPAAEPPPQEDEAELAELRAALAMSQAETLREEQLKEKMLSQEEADLARALEASMSATSWHNNSYSSGAGEHSTTAAGSSSQPPNETEFAQLDYMDDAAFARLLAAQEQDEPTPTQTSFTPNAMVNSIPPPQKADAPDRSPPLVSPPTSHNGDLPVYSPRRPPAALPAENGGDPELSADEQFARQLALEEEVLARESKDKPPEDPPSSALAENGKPPMDTVLVTDLPKMKYGGTELTWVDASLESPVMLIEAGRPASVDATNFRSPSGLLYPPDSIRPVSSAASYSDESDGRSMGAYQFLDDELLRGVSIGFVAPTISPELVPMTGSMPNIISLPYGRCPPLHLQAPTWRHLLRLMARLSGTRIEPTVEALAVTRSTQMQLRTVVQFVRTHHTSPDWRAVLWFTIDHPVPPHMPNARKYINGDPDVLPWSYALSSLPALLRDGSDTPLSKFFTIPASAAVPFPSLPISFPNMMAYLQAALDESRKYMNDSSSGMRKLAKMVEMCYPQTVEPGEDEDKGRSVGGLIKKVIGRGGRKDRTKKDKRGNDDTYELVTPFVLDDWGP